MRIHFIAVGGAVMHNLAMAMHNLGHRVSGSDDEIFEPSRSRLESYGLLPEKFGWDSDRITKDLDGVILGMHAREENPELLKAQELGLKIWSFPEYIYEQSKDKRRVVIGGSHGKTTVTSMIMHVLWYNHIDFDYMVGSQLEGFETMVKLSSDAPIIILEGDEYLSSPIDLRPKFHLYHPHIAVLTGIAWDHMNVFPTYENYLEQFGKFSRMLDKDGVMYWYKQDSELDSICSSLDCRSESYEAHPYILEDSRTYLTVGNERFPVPVFGNHNMQNIAAALAVCKELGVSDGQFYEAIASFKGAARRQEILASSGNKIVYLDFAHAPSKVAATINSFREMYHDQPIYAFLELHTFSSLNMEFLPQYAGSLDPATKAVVYYNPKVVAHKKLPPVEAAFVKSCFGGKNLEIINDRLILEEKLAAFKEDGVYLFMSSGNFSGLNLQDIATSLIS